MITFCINQSDAVTAVSESLKQDTYKHFKTTRDIEVIPNFIDVSPSDPELTAKLREKYHCDVEPMLCHISNFRKVKRVEDVIEVFKRVNDVMPSRLLLVGDGPERSKLEDMCRRLDLCDRIRFVGKVRETQHVLGISDLFLLPSETESFGLAALEAMAMGVPVISTNTGGLPEVNVHGVTGYLSDVGDVDDMAKNALYLLGDKQRYETFRQNALEQARKFNIEDVVQLYEELYEKLVVSTSARSV